MQWLRNSSIDFVGGMEHAARMIQAQLSILK
jgi:hypothetical protein